MNDGRNDSWTEGRKESDGNNRATQEFDRQFGTKDQKSLIGENSVEEGHNRRVQHSDQRLNVELQIGSGCENQIDGNGEERSEGEKK